MRLLSVDGRPVDLMMVQQRLLGNYSQLLIDMCGITDRSEPPLRSLPPLVQQDLHRDNGPGGGPDLTHQSGSSSDLV